ncbi:fatty acid desaturase [Paracrocinitomix mangrovi]|uniref:fatty acid desaturase family protein n=1 Tax=Paracrocinitomix mangrovi TaxID=2862509 RepID=UPI001C8D606D|nr:fatty acid desaturase [Paracrocinitomix mangrovi]UKN01044.1 fatty acid desaturase [Paracrocinitomix mangrovi]
MKTTEIKKSVHWHDLTNLSKKEIFIENSITVPWFVGSLLAAHYQLYWLALPLSFFFFLTALRQVHNGFHNSLGINKKLTEINLLLNSVLMLASMHAVKFNHLRHHKYCLGEKDYEGKCARLNWYQAILYGPIHIFNLHYFTFKYGNHQYKKYVILELSLIAIFITVVFALQIKVLIYHILTMFLAEFFSAFFAVWSVHHHSEDQPHQARTQRTKWKNMLSFNMFYHMEHHLFPAVPTIKMPELARRIDKAFPSMKTKQTF